MACPFKGLASFDMDDAGVFFGRERLVAEMVARLTGAPLMGIVGPSGSGKSSALRAGLLAALAAGVLPGSERWALALLRPGEHPVRALEQALAEAAPHGRLIVAVDQFEEVFTACREESERAAFVDALVACPRDPRRRCLVLVAVRADFYGRCAGYPELSRLLGANHVLVGPMRRDELRRAIELPARRAGLRVEPELTDALIADVEGEPGALPLLSTSLLELWQHRDGRRLRLSAYEHAGGVRGAVARLAETAYERLDPERPRSRARDPAAAGGRGRGRRRRAPPSAARRVRAPGATRGPGRARRGPAGHDRRGRGGGRARGAAARVAAPAWLARGGRRRPPTAPAPHPRRPRLARRGPRARRAVSRRPAGLHAGLDRRPRARAQRPRARVHRREPRRGGAWRPSASRHVEPRLRALLAGVAVLLALAVVAGAVALSQRGEARDAALVADAQRLGAEALIDDRLDHALLLARAGVELHDSAATRGSLLSVLQRSPAALGVVRGDGWPLYAVAVSSDDRLMAIGDAARHGHDLRPRDPPAAGRAYRIRGGLVQPLCPSRPTGPRSPFPASIPATAARASWTSSTRSRGSGGCGSSRLASPAKRTTS